MTKVLKEKYKTYEGARKRAAFENAIAKAEFNRGLKAHHYHYSVVLTLDPYTGDDVWEVRRTLRGK
jgi:hypothetical protein